MAQPLLHIGYHKTGTTWLQRELFTDDSPVFVPLNTRRAGNSSLGLLFAFGRDKYLLSSFDQNQAEIQKEVAAILQSKGDVGEKIPVLSHERLSGNPHSSGFDAKIIAERLKAAFPDGKVLIVIREQRSFLLSNYFQYLSQGGTHSLKKYLFTPYDGKRPGFSPHHINYTPLVSEYYQLFGRENVLVLPYELFQEKPADFIGEIGKFIGVEIPVSPERFKIRRNQKANHYVNYHLRWFNYFLFYSSLNNYSGWYSKPLARLARIKKNVASAIIPQRLNTRIQQNCKHQIDQWVGDRYVASNKKLAKLTGLPLENYGYM